MLPRFFTTPASAVGCTRMVLKVPSVVLISSRPSTFMVTGTVRCASTTGMTKLWPSDHGLRRGVEDAGQQIGEAAVHRRLHMLGLAGHLVLLVEDRLGAGVIEPQRGVDLAAAFDGLLVEVVGAALLAVEVGLEVVGDVEEHVDGAAGVGDGGDALAVAGLLKVDDGGAGGKDAPIDGVGEGLLLGKAEAGARRRERSELLGWPVPEGRGCQGKSAKEADCVRACLQCSARLLMDST